jgi:hypothetical protein
VEQREYLVELMQLSPFLNVYIPLFGGSRLRQVSTCIGQKGGPARLLQRARQITSRLSMEVPVQNEYPCSVQRKKKKMNVFSRAHLACCQNPSRRRSAAHSRALPSPDTCGARQGPASSPCAQRRVQKTRDGPKKHSGHVISSRTDLFLPHNLQIDQEGS